MDEPLDGLVKALDAAAKEIEGRVDPPTALPKEVTHDVTTAIFGTLGGNKEVAEEFIAKVLQAVHSDDVVQLGALVAEQVRKDAERLGADYAAIPVMIKAHADRNSFELKVGKGPLLPAEIVTGALLITADVLTESRVQNSKRAARICLILRSAIMRTLQMHVEMANEEAAKGEEEDEEDKSQGLN